MTKYVGIIGYPLGHSVSPVFQQAAFDYHNLDVRYESWETTPGELEGRIMGLRDAKYLGANVTVPYKEAAMAVLDEIEEVAAMVGAVNTIINRNGKLIGHNTDAVAFLQALSEIGFDPLNKRVLLLGSGGSARAAAMAMGQQGLEHLFISNRTEARARRLAGQVGPLVPEIEVLEFSPEILSEAAQQCDLIVNCTPMGMRGGPAEGQSPLLPEAIPSGIIVNDLVYNPPLTPLLSAAQAAGAKILNGLPMLIHQGAAAFELWTELNAPIEVMHSAAEVSLEMDVIPVFEAQATPMGSQGGHTPVTTHVSRPSVRYTERRNVSQESREA
jgi:shikimate dehydrogenase